MYVCIELRVPGECCSSLSPNMRLRMVEVEVGCRVGGGGGKDMQR